MLRIAIVCFGSLAVAAIVTAVLLQFRTTRALLKLLQVGAIGTVAVYATTFVVFYRPEIWPQIAIEIVLGIARVNVDVLTGLGGTLAGMLFAQRLIARRERK